MIKRLFVALMLVVTAACGGGGGGGSSPRTVAEAGTPQNIAKGVPKRLDGTRSKAPAGYNLIYDWQLVAQPVGDTAALDDKTIASPTFTPNQTGTYEWRLTVKGVKQSSWLNKLPLGIAQAWADEIATDTVTMTAWEPMDILVLYTDKIEAWLARVPVEDIPIHIQNGYPHLKEGWENGTVKAVIIHAPTVDEGNADFYEVFEGQVRKKPDAP